MAILLMMLMSLTASADVEDNYVLLDSGEEVLLIDVDTQDSLYNRNSANDRLSKRVRNLERAVRALQKRVYDLEEVDNVPQKKRYTCEFRSCRQSTSVHHANKHNCNFFKMWRSDRLRVWARDARNAERNVVSSIKKSSDIKLYKADSISCER